MQIGRVAGQQVEGVDCARLPESVSAGWLAHLSPYEAARDHQIFVRRKICHRYQKELFCFCDEVAPPPRPPIPAADQELGPVLST